MKCEEVKKFLNDYLLGELDPAIEIQINEHLNECANCQKDLKERENTVSILKDACRYAPAEEAYEKIRARLEPRKKARPVWMPNWTKSLIFAAAAFLLGMVLMRTADILLIDAKQKPPIEAGYKPAYRIPFSDTIKFYTAPSKTLVKL